MHHARHDLFAGPRIATDQHRQFGIGYLLNQIRLHGENRETIDEVVNLSIRYGIITPYTTFLVEEPEIKFMAEN